MRIYVCTARSPALAALVMAVKAHKRPRPCRDIAEQISNLERRAMSAERDATDRYLSSYLEGRVGAEFDGRIRGVTRFGLFVTLDESGADGFIPIKDDLAQNIFITTKNATRLLVSAAAPNIGWAHRRACAWSRQRRSLAGYVLKFYLSQSALQARPAPANQPTPRARAARKNPRGDKQPLTRHEKAKAKVRRKAKDQSQVHQTG